MLKCGECFVEVGVEVGLVVDGEGCGGWCVVRVV